MGQINKHIILGIETSCDDTCVAIYCSEKGLLANECYRQSIHYKYGGVVPELASRDHLQHLPKLLEAALGTAKLKLDDLTGVAYTRGPGLMGALLVGASYAKSLSYGLKIPCLGVNHLEGHIISTLLSSPKPSFPFLVLLISGGHTQLLHAKALGEYELLGETLDDALGEAFDKTAKLLGLGYPGGSELARLASLGETTPYVFPKPLCNKAGLNFSFSGLKTFVLNTYNKSAKTKIDKINIAKAFEIAVSETLYIKCSRAIVTSFATRLVVAGGVAANQAIRSKLQLLATEKNIEVFFPDLNYCSDNGAMIALAGLLKMQQGNFDSDLSIKVESKKEL